MIDNKEKAALFVKYWSTAIDGSLVNLESCIRSMLDEADRARNHTPECSHSDSQRIGEMGGRFQDEWCKDCGSFKSWDNYVSSGEASTWRVPRLYVKP